MGDIIFFAKEYKNNPNLAISELIAAGFVVKYYSIIFRKRKLPGV
jgi:hypothetical protein